MAMELPREFVNLLRRRGVHKVLTTIGDDGFPHAALKQTLQVDSAGRLFYLELMESSVTNRNMVASLWFHRPVSILVSGTGGVSWELQGRPLRTLIAGPEFKKHYRLAHHRYGAMGLAAVWIIEPLALRDQSRTRRLLEEREAHPFFVHLDRLAIPGQARRRAGKD